MGTKVITLEQKDLDAALPDQSDFFVCDIFDATPKGDMASMAHPIFSLSTKPERRIRRYESGENYIEIRPSTGGLATIHDRDILIYCISQIIAALNRGDKVSQTIRLKAIELMRATNRGTDGRGYAQLKAALDRLQGTQIITNIVTGGVTQRDNFGLIDRSRTLEREIDGSTDLEIKLSDWVFNAIRNREVLTLHHNYFRLRKPLERRMYELARKHCGHNKEWRMPLVALSEKCGSNTELREFRRMVREIAKQDAKEHHMPDYAVSLEKSDVVLFRNRATMPKVAPKRTPRPIDAIQLDPETYHDARTAAPGWDVYYLEQQWRDWVTEMDLDPPRDPYKAFIGFCRKWQTERGAP
jgi:plasmid replication initiation protein